MKKRNKTSSPTRGNLKWECLLWTLVTFGIVLALIAAYDLLARNWFDSANAAKECFVRFSYTHFAVLIAFVAAVFSFISIVVTAKVNESMNLHSLNLLYGDDRMLTAVRTLAKVERRWNDAKASGIKPGASAFDIPPDAITRTESRNDYCAIKILNDSKFVVGNDLYKPWTEDEDRARRFVKNYFSSALELYLCGGIGRRTLRVICDTDAITLLFNVIEPMESITNEGYKFDVFYKLMKVIKDVYAAKVEKSKNHNKVSHYRKA